MATRKRSVRTINKKTKTKTNTKSKYFMKGCAVKNKNKSLAFKIKHRKTCPKCRLMRGGCGTCSNNMNGGVGSLGFLDNMYNIGTNFTTGISNFTNSVLYAAPPGVNALPTVGQFANKYN
jgi:hypothetical protein